MTAKSQGRAQRTHAGIIEEPSKLHQLKSKKLTPVRRDSTSGFAGKPHPILTLTSAHMTCLQYTDPTVRDESVATGAFVYLHTPVLGPNMEEMRAKEMREVGGCCILCCTPRGWPVCLIAFERLFAY